MDKLAAMRTFVSIVENRSLTEAARRLGKSVPAVVRSLAGLEGDLGVQLLVRTTRQSHLTEEGRNYYQLCIRVLREIDGGEALLLGGDDGPSGEIKITAPVEFGRRYVAPIIFSLRDQFPRIVFRTVLRDRPLELVDGGFDLAVRIGNVADSQLHTSRVGWMGSRLCASPGLAARLEGTRSPEELTGVPSICIDIAGRRSGDRWLFVREDGISLSVKGTTVLHTDSVAVAVDACRAGIGVCAFLTYQVVDLLAEGRLVSLMQSWMPPPKPVVLLRHTPSLRPARVNEVIGLFERDLQNQLREFGDMP